MAAIKEPVRTDIEREVIAGWRVRHDVAGVGEMPGSESATARRCRVAVVPHGWSAAPCQPEHFFRQFPLEQVALPGQDAGECERVTDVARISSRNRPERSSVVVAKQ